MNSFDASSVCWRLEELRPYLKSAVVLVQQMKPVVALKDLVTKLGVGEAQVGVRSLLDELLAQQIVQAYRPADVREEVDHVQLLVPVQIVHDDRLLDGPLSRRLVAIPEVLVVIREDRADRRRNFVGVVLDRVRIDRWTFSVLVTWIADPDGRVTDQTDHLVTFPQEAYERGEHQQIAEVQTVRGRIETGVQALRLVELFVHAFPVDEKKRVRQLLADKLANRLLTDRISI